MSVRSLPLLAALAALIAFAGARRADASPLRVGSKRFTESYILAEIATQTVRASGQSDATHLEGLGATAIALKALEDGAIDLYPDYTGTIAEAVLGRVDAGSFEGLASDLDARGLGLIGPLGFENTYALAVRADLATARGLTTISDLARHPDVAIGVSHEFLGRADGWPGLAARYGLHAGEVRAMDHGLAYAALLDRSADVVDAYSTDAKIAKYGLRLLRDDRRFFPTYAACFLYRKDARARLPGAFSALEALRGAIDADAMRAMNAEAELDGRAFADVARDFINRRHSTPDSAGTAPAVTGDRLEKAGTPGRSPQAGTKRSFIARLGRSVVRYGPRHVFLLAVALCLSTLVGVGLGIVAARWPAVGGVILGATGVVQTIPSLALLCLFIPLFGIGVLPALVALFAYGILPITRNTCTALNEIPAPIRDSARAIGLTPLETLRFVELPLASRTILAGIKTSAVLTVGTATVAAFIGAGGFGEPISVGLNLNDVPTMLEGAIPAALLALIVQALFQAVDRVVVPRGLRVASILDGRERGI